MSINIKSLPELALVKVPSYDEILQANEAELKKQNPQYTRQAGADDTMMLEAASYRELALRTEVAGWVKDLFWISASGDALDYHASNVGIKRAAGTKPTADYTFTLSVALAYDVTIPQGTVLGDEGGDKKAWVLNDVVITAGQTEITTKVELQEFVESSAVKTEVVLTPLPFITKAEAKTDFTEGADRESDDVLRARIDLSFADKSTAGARRTYSSYALRADSRIKDVNVLNKGGGKVGVIYYADVMDDVMRERIDEALNVQDVRPLTDIVETQEAQVIKFDVQASVTIRSDQDAGVYAKAVENLTAELKKQQTINNVVRVSEIIALLKIEGVEDVQVTSPAHSLTATSEQVLIANDIQITQIRS